MKFFVINPAETSNDIVEAEDMRELYPGLGLVNVDHGVVLPPHLSDTRVGIGIVVDENSLFVPPEKQRYFAIGKQLYGGNAVCYGFQEGGDTVDLELVPAVSFMSVAGIEKAIAAGQIVRPVCAINGVVYWRWPEQAPAS